MANTVSRSRTGANTQALRSPPVKYRWPRNRWKRCWHNPMGRLQLTSCSPVKSLLARAIRFWQSITPNARSRINAQNLYEILAAATLILSVTTPYSQPYASAWQQIEAVARDLKNPGSLDALVVLAREEALPPMPPVGDNASLSLDTTSTSKSTPDTQSGDTLTLNLTATPPPAPPGRTMRLHGCSERA